jgi:hypothetical protein
MLAASLFFVNPPKKGQKGPGCLAIRLHNGFVVCFLSESTSAGLKSLPLDWRQKHCIHTKVGWLL